MKSLWRVLVVAWLGAMGVLSSGWAQGDPPGPPPTPGGASAPEITGIAVTGLSRVGGEFRAAVTMTVHNFANCWHTAPTATSVDTWPAADVTPDPVNGDPYTLRITVPLGTVAKSYPLQIMVGNDSNAASLLKSAARSITVSVPLSLTLTAKVTAVTDLTATVAVSATSAAASVAVMEDAWNPLTAPWQPIQNSTIVNGKRVFNVAVLLRPFAGLHSLYVAVKNDDLGYVAKAVKTPVKVAGPKILTLTPTSARPGVDTPTIKGSGFDTLVDGASGVTIGGVAAPLFAWTNLSIQCLVPAGLAPGRANVVVTTRNGFPSLAKSLTLVPFWTGAWAGTWQDAGGADAPHGWQVAAIKAGTGNAITLTLATGEIFKGTVDTGKTPLEFTATYKYTDGTISTLTGTLTPAALAIAGTSTDGGVFSAALVPARPLGLLLPGIYLIRSVEKANSHGLPLALERMKFYSVAGSATAPTMKDLMDNSTFKGAFQGNVFAFAGKTWTVSGHVTEPDANGPARTLAGAYQWSNTTGEAWGEYVGERSNGTPGQANGTTQWTISEDAGLPFTVSVTISANSITIVRADAHPATLRGKIYQRLDGTSSAFVASDATMTLYGVITGATMSGATEEQDGAHTFTGAKL